jgi:preprotein translocase subunit SecA
MSLQPTALVPLDAMPIEAATPQRAAPAVGLQTTTFSSRIEVLKGPAPAPPRLDEKAIPWQLQARSVRSRVTQRGDVKAVRDRQADWLTQVGAAESGTRAALRVRLIGQGLTPHLRDEALACVAAKVHRALGRDPYDSQIECAQALLDGLLVEMANGEGKSLAVAMAAATYALSGEPVHVFTANDFLAARDARQHAALFVALGLRVGVINAGSNLLQRRAAYAADVVYTTAQDLARDHLRDSQQKTKTLSDASTASPMFPRGLCCALVDEADQVLIDEATVPLDLVEVQEDPDLHAACIVALALARRVRLDVDALIDLADCSVQWTDVGVARVELLSAPLGAGWLGRADRQELLSQALVALHALHADHDYLVRGERVDLLGHAQERAEWPRSLQTLVEIKEGCRPSPVLRTVARTRLQRLFPLYKHLAGTADSLVSCQDELAALYDQRVRVVQRRKPVKLTELPQQVFEASCLREAAAVQRVKAMVDEKRAVLVGVANADAAMALSAALHAAAIDHRVADGRDDSQDAAHLQRAGQAGAVTVLTLLASRGVPIPVAPEVASVGGLYALDLLDTPCARTRAQFYGRVACQAEPGSAETWHAADLPCWDRTWLDLPAKGSPQWMVDAASRMQQLVHRWATRRERRRLLLG